MKQAVLFIVLAVVALPWQASAQTDHANSIQQNWLPMSVRRFHPALSLTLWELILLVISTTAVTGA